jgi:anti-sigma factor RsiW
MTCRKVQSALQAVVDGAASRGEREAVDAHVAHCTACAQTLAESRQLVSLLAGLPARRVSDDFERNLQAALRETKPAPHSVAWWERFRLQFEWKLRVPAMVTAGALTAGMVAALVMPSYVHYQEQVEQREQLVSSAVERHQQLERANPGSDWDTVEGSIELTTGSVVIE